MRFFDLLFKSIYETFYQDIDDGEIYVCGIIILFTLMNLLSLVFFIELYTGKSTHHYSTVIATFSVVFGVLLYFRYIFNQRFRKLLFRMNTSFQKTSRFLLIYALISIVLFIIALFVN